MALTLASSAFAVGTPVRQQAVARPPARRAARSARYGWLFWLALDIINDADDFCECRSAAPVRAKYGDESQFFDLDVSDRQRGIFRENCLADPA